MIQPLVLLVAAIVIGGFLFYSFQHIVYVIQNFGAFVSTVGDWLTYAFLGVCGLVLALVALVVVAGLLGRIKRRVIGKEARVKDFLERTKDLTAEEQRQRWLRENGKDDYG